MVPFIPRLIPAILPNLAHHALMIQSAAIKTNKLLLSVVQALPSPPEAPRYNRAAPASPTPMPVTSVGTSKSSNTRGDTQSLDIHDVSVDGRAPSSLGGEIGNVTQKSRGNTFGSINSDAVATASQMNALSRPQSPNSVLLKPITHSLVAVENDLFDYQATVNELTVQFLSEHEETRVAALKWLIMLHQKAPKHVSNSFSYITIFLNVKCTLV